MQGTTTSVAYSPSSQQLRHTYWFIHLAGAGTKHGGISSGINLVIRAEINV